MTCFLILNSSQLPKQKENLRFRPAHGRNGGFLLVRGSGRKQTAISCRKVRLAHPGWPGIPLSGICRMAAALKYGEYSARFISKQSRKAPTATRHLPRYRVLSSTKERFAPLPCICRFAAALRCLAVLAESLLSCVTRAFPAGLLLSASHALCPFPRLAHCRGTGLWISRQHCRANRHSSL